MLGDQGSIIVAIAFIALYLVPIIIAWCALIAYHAVSDATPVMARTEHVASHQVAHAKLKSRGRVDVPAPRISPSAKMAPTEKFAALAITRLPAERSRGEPERAELMVP
jgi:hypothetical protein